MKPKRRFPGSLFRWRTQPKQSQRLGSFDRSVLDAVQALGEEANQARIRESVEKSGGWPVSVGGISTFLQRLVEEGQLEASMPEDEPAAKQALHYRVTEKGLESLAKSRDRSS